MLTGGSGTRSRYSDSLRAGSSGDPNPVKATFSAPVQTETGGPHPASYTKGTGSFPGVKRPVRDIDYPPPPTTMVLERLELYIYPSLGLPGLF